MRTAFELSGDCSYDFEFSLPIVGLPFCTVPSLTEPTLVVHIPEIIAPEIDIPALCHCISFDVSYMMRVDNKPWGGIDFGIVPSTQDCCDLGFDVNLTLDIPCMPFNMTVDEKVLIVAGKVGELYFGIEKLPDCEFEFNLGISIPCLPFVMTVTSNIELTDSDLNLYFNITKPEPEPQDQLVTIVTAYTAFDTTQYLSIVTQVAGITYDITLDEQLVPHYFTAPDGSWTFVLETAPVTCAVPITQFTVDTRVHYTQYSYMNTQELFTYTQVVTAPCEFEFDLSIDIPCLPLAFEAGGNIEVADAANLTIAITRIAGGGGAGSLDAGACEFEMSVDIDIPCLPLVFGATGILDVGGEDEHLNIGITRNASTGVCEFELSLDVAIPCMPFAMNAAVNISELATGSPPEATFYVTAGGGECEFEFDLSIGIGAHPIYVPDCSSYTIYAGVEVANKVAWDSPIVLNLDVIPHTCSWEIGLSLDVPVFSCNDISVEVVHQAINYGDYSPSVKLSVVKTDCDIDLGLDIWIPQACEEIVIGIAHEVYKTGSPGYVNLTAFQVGDCSWNIGISVVVPSGGGGGISCGDLVEGTWISIADDCTIGHDCANALDAAFRLTVAYDVYFYENAGDLDIDVYGQIWSFEYQCGHLVNQGVVDYFDNAYQIDLGLMSCGDVDACIGEVISCGDLIEGTWISLGDDCTIAHDCVQGMAGNVGLTLVNDIYIGQFSRQVYGGVYRAKWSVDIECGHIVAFNFATYLPPNYFSFSVGLYTCSDILACGYEIADCSDVLDCLPDDLISCGDLDAGTWLSVGADCVIGHEGRANDEGYITAVQDVYLAMGAAGTLRPVMYRDIFSYNYGHIAEGGWDMVTGVGIDLCGAVSGCLSGASTSITIWQVGVTGNKVLVFENGILQP